MIQAYKTCKCYEVRGMNGQCLGFRGVSIVERMAHHGYFDRLLYHKHRCCGYDPGHRMCRKATSRYWPSVQPGP